MLLAATLAAVTIAVVAAVVLPLLRARRDEPERARIDRAVYRDQLKELERDRERGLIDESAAATARLEIERRLLAAESRAAPAPRAGGTSPVLAILLALMLPAAAALLYVRLGAPGVADQPYASRAQERSVAASGHGDMEKTIAALEGRLRAHPERSEDWLLLARSAAALGQWQKSADAYREALRLTGGARTDISAAYGEVLVAASDGVVTPAARDVLSGVLARDPGNPVARFYLALADAQGGNAEAAIAAWQKLAADEPAESPMRAELKTRMAEVARSAGLPAPELAPPRAGPGAAEMAKAAEMPPEERQTMIRNMVEGLAAKLAQNPDDLEGWKRLGRAYGVLGEREKAVDAYEHAARLRPDDPGILVAEAEALMPDRSPQTPVPENVVGLLRRVEAMDARQPAALWYLGLAAAQQRRFGEARNYWQRLLAEMPPESDARQAVAAALEALKDK
jgi:cytochrome c-type biogenesis protein CcmH